MAEQVKLSLFNKHQSSLTAYRDLYFEKLRGAEKPNANKAAEFQANIIALAIELNPKLKNEPGNKEEKYAYAILLKAGSWGQQSLRPEEYEQCLFQAGEYLQALGVTNIQAKPPETEHDLLMKTGRLR